MNVMCNNEVVGPAGGTSGQNKAEYGAEEDIDGIRFFEGVDEFLCSLPIPVDDGDKLMLVSVVSKVFK